jgi:histone acetyltransferase (RNA polymerase elongator complex component)
MVELLQTPFKLFWRASVPAIFVFVIRFPHGHCLACNGPGACVSADSKLTNFPQEQKYLEVRTFPNRKARIAQAPC